MVKELNYYAGGNTAKGFIHFFESNFQTLDRLFILKGGPGTGKSTMMKKIGDIWKEKGYSIEWIHCSSDYGSVDVVIVPEIKAGIVDGTAPHVIEPALPGIVDDYVNIGVAWDRTKLLDKKSEVVELNNQIKTAYQNAYIALNNGLTKLLEEEEKQNDVKIPNDWLPEKSLEKESQVFYRFAGAFTPDGYKDFTENITSDVITRIILEGISESQITLQFESIIEELRLKGYNIEIYFNALNPEWIDMIKIPELQLAVLNNKFCESFIQVKSSDKVYNVKDEKEPSFVNHKKYKIYVEAATNYLGQTKQLRSQLEGIYIKAMDFSVVDQIQNEINNELEQLARN